MCQSSIALRIYVTYSAAVSSDNPMSLLAVNPFLLLDEYVSFDGLLLRIEIRFKGTLKL